MAPKKVEMGVAGVSRPLASEEDREKAWKGSRLAVGAEGEKKLYSVPILFAKLFSARWREHLETEGVGKNAITLMHKPGSVKFVMDWLINGGMDATGKDALAYPQGNLENLQKIRKLAEFLQIEKLVERIDHDIKTIKEVPRGPKGTKGKRAQPVTNALAMSPKKIQRCFNCNDPSHVRAYCPLLSNKEFLDEGGWFKYSPANVKPAPFPSATTAVAEKKVANADEKLEQKTLSNNVALEQGASSEGGKAGESTVKAGTGEEKNAKDISQVDGISEEKAMSAAVAEGGVKVAEITRVLMYKMNFIVTDQNGFEWCIPKSRIFLTVEGVGKDGQLKFSGSAPFQYSWYELDEDYKKAAQAEAAATASQIAGADTALKAEQIKVKSQQLGPQAALREVNGNASSKVGKANVKGKGKASKSITNSKSEQS